MNTFLSIMVMFCTTVVLLGCFLLLRYCLKNNTEVKEGESMGHSFDGIEEINNPLPKWWSVMFFITIIYSVGYLILFPGFGNFKGVLNWSSSNQEVLNLAESQQAADYAKADGTDVMVQYDREVAQADDKYGPIFEAFAARSVEDLAGDDEARRIGQRLFLQNCALCHGSDAKGSKGFPNLTDADWLYGGTPATIKQSLMHGRNGMMPAKGGLPIDDAEVPALVEYVRSLSGTPHDSLMASDGLASYQKGCFACHGMSGEGNKALGAPALNDTVWLYGGGRADITHSIINGRSGKMPAWDKVLGDDKVHLITAYVYSLSVGKVAQINPTIVPVKARPGAPAGASSGSDDGVDFAALAARPMEELASDADAKAAGKKLFAANCTVCHGANAQGMGNFPNLTDSEWIYGGSTADIKTTIMHGRTGKAGNMPAWDKVLGEDKVHVISAYVYSLSNE
ncbi:cytochrome-c oxidase, cbb3-type subunit III [uncultured Ferrimonas sp.]|uniref:cytochrome-c oxidase, cbb3-type subunit III n=1 Tax=uncultured Ferrimonas sp. TaxID=432640 RepID=UPI002614E49B|nr:cytochrome-c oxidase, cbb3-type subunit III [uncultured Ferrimonas sp.]